MEKPRFKGQPVQPRFQGEAQPPSVYDSGFGFDDVVANAFTFGLSDEVTSAAMAPVRAAGKALKGQGPSSVLDALSEAYSEDRAEYLAAEERYHEENPGKTLGGTIMGSVGAVGPAAVKTFKAAAGPVVNTIRGAIGGGAGAAATGFTTGKDGVEGRVENAMEQLPAGIIMGGAIPAAANTVGKGVNWLSQKMLDGRTLNDILGEIGMSRSSKGKLDDVLGQEGLTYGAAKSKASELGPDAMLLDMGPNLSDTAEVIASLPGSGQKAIRDALQTRRQEAPARITGAADEAMGEQRNVAETVDALISSRSTQARPLFEQAMDKPVVWTDRLQEFLDEPTIKRGLRDGLEIQRLEALARGEKFDPTNYAITDFDAAGDPIVSKIPNMRTLQAAKIGLDSAIEKYRDPITGRLNLDQRGRAIDELRRSFVSQLDATNPAYASARKAWAGPSAVRDAMALGQDVFDRSVRPDQLAQRVGAMSKDELDGLRIGLRDQLEEIRGTARSDANAARALFETGWNKEKLGIVLGEKEADAFIKTLAGETNFENTRRQITGNSRTMPRAERAKEWTTNPTKIEQTLGPSETFYGTGKHWLGKGANMLIGGARERSMQQARDEVGQILSARGGERDAILDALTNADARLLQNAEPARITAEKSRRIMEALLLSNAVGSGMEPIGR